MRILLACLLAFPVVAHAADELPKRKAGLWETKVIEGAGPMAGQSVKQCIDEKTDELARAQLAGSGTCEAPKVAKTGAGYEIDTTCKMGPIATVGHTVMTGDFNSLIKMQVSSKVTGMPQQAGNVEHKQVMEMRYLGACAPDQKPGDIITADGKVMRTPAAK